MSFSNINASNFNVSNNVFHNNFQVYPPASTQDFAYSQYPSQQSPGDSYFFPQGTDQTVHETVQQELFDLRNYPDVIFDSIFSFSPLPDTEAEPSAAAATDSVATGIIHSSSKREIDPSYVLKREKNNAAVRKCKKKQRQEQDKKNEAHDLLKIAHEELIRKNADLELQLQAKEFVIAQQAALIQALYKKIERGSTT